MEVIYQNDEQSGLKLWRTILIIPLRLLDCPLVGNAQSRGGAQAEICCRNKTWNTVLNKAKQHLRAHIFQQ